MAKFELSIYGKNDEALKKFETDHVRWGVLLQAIKLQEKIKNKEPEEQFAAIADFIKSIFDGITDTDILKADAFDVINTFKQLISLVGNINGGNSKNV